MARGLVNNRANENSQTQIRKEKVKTAMRMGEMFPSKWLKAEDFEEDEKRVVTIKGVDFEELTDQRGKKENKPVLYFRDEKPLILNKTNASIIEHLYGDETDDWIGKKIILFAMEVDSFGDIVRAVRVKNQVPKAVASHDQQSEDQQSQFEGASDYSTPASLTPQQMAALWAELQQEGRPLGVLLKPLPPTVTLEQFQTWQLKAREQINTARAAAAQSDDEDSDPFADN